MVSRIAIVALASACSLSTARYAGTGDDAGTDAGDDAGGDDVPDVSHSGARLQIVRAIFDGSSTPIALYDSVLQTRCDAALWSDGSYYCTPPSIPVNSQMPPEQLVVMTYAHDAGDALSNRYLRGADGSQIADPAVLHDNQLATDCQMSTQASALATTYCTPIDMAIAQEFSDGSCTQPMIDVGGTAPAYVAATPGVFACDVISQVFTVGAATTVANVYVASAHGCSAQSSSTSVYPAMQPIQLASLVHHPVKQPGRRIENAIRTVGAQQFLDGDFFDTTLGTWCAPRQVGAELKCMPEGLDVQRFYTDATCTTPILVVDVVRPERCQWSQLPYAIDMSTGSLAIRAVTNTPLAQLYQQGATCEPTDQQFFFTLGDPIDPSSFETGSIVTDPVMP